MSNKPQTTYTRDVKALIEGAIVPVRELKASDSDVNVTS